MTQDGGRVRDGRPSLAADAPLFTRPFVLTCLATFLFYLSFCFILPVMPLYVADLGGTPAQLGLIIGGFAFTAMLLRPPGGWIIDTQGNRLVLLAGMAIFMLASLAYAAVRSVNAILLVRLFHGMGMGLFPTAATVVVAELSPLTRRGEAMGWFGIANSVALILGPAAGTVVAGWMGYSVLFLVAGGTALLGLLCLLLLPRIGQPSGWKGGVRWRDFFSRAAVLPSSVLLFLCLPYGMMVAFIPIIAARRGLGNPGTFYTVFALAAFLVRAKAGEMSDRRGRGAVILPGMLLAALAFTVLGVTSGPIGVLTGAAIFGLASGSAQPALMALTTDRVPPEERGKAMGTFYTAWELGIASGAAGAGWLLSVTDFAALFLVGAAMPIGGACLALRVRRGQ
jgi:MFS family permease